MPSLAHPDPCANGTRNELVTSQHSADVAARQYAKAKAALAIIAAAAEPLKMGPQSWSLMKNGHVWCARAAHYVSTDASPVTAVLDLALNMAAAMRTGWAERLAGLPWISEDQIRALADAIGKALDSLSPEDT